MNRPRHPREIALEQKLVDLVTDPREAAKRLLHHAYHLSRRKEPPYQELLIESLKMGAKALERQADLEKENEWLTQHYDPFPFCAISGCEAASNTCHETCPDSVRNRIKAEIEQRLKEKTNEENH